VGQFVRVAIVDSLDDLNEYSPGVIFREVPVGLEPIEELSSFAEAGWWKGYSVTRKTLRSSSKVS